MVEGLDADDGYIQVEDEFMATAQLFTRHLHHAEYQRQKHLARSKNVGAVQSITRPVDGRTQTSLETKIKLDAKDQRQRARAAVANVYSDEKVDSEEGEDDPWLRDPRLAGLMAQKENTAPLGKITGIQSASRAALGYTQGQPSPMKQDKSRRTDHLSSADVSLNQGSAGSPRRTCMQADDDDSDDLDAAMYRASPTRNFTPYTKIRGAAPFEDLLEEKIGPPSKATVLKSKAGLVEKTSFSRTHGRDTADGDGGNEDDIDLFAPFPLRSYRPNEHKPIRKAQDLAKKKAEDTKGKASPQDEIPTFLV